MPFIDRAWWTALSLVLIAVWLTFLVVGTRSAQSYLLAVAPELPIGGRADWRNKEGQLILSGWSNAEATFRWSDTPKPSLCVKPMAPKAGEASERRYSLGLDMAAIEDLVGKDVGLIVNGTRHPETIRIQSDWAWYWIDVVYSVRPTSICVALDLPATSRRSFRDSRSLGVRLREVQLR